MPMYRLALMCDILNECEIPNMEAVRKLFSSMHDLHDVTKLDTGSKISSQIQNLRPNQMMGIYVRNSNCGLMMMRSPSEQSYEMTIASFQPNLTNEQIYGNEDSVKGDIQVIMSFTKLNMNCFAYDSAIFYKCSLFKFQL